MKAMISFFQSPKAAEEKKQASSSANGNAAKTWASIAATPLYPIRESAQKAMEEMKQQQQAGAQQWMRSRAKAK